MSQRRAFAGLLGARLMAPIPLIAKNDVDQLWLMLTMLLILQVLELALRENAKGKLRNLKNANDKYLYNS